MERLPNATCGDLAGVYKYLAEAVGVDNAFEIYHQFKGMQIMFPLKFYSNDFIAQQIVEGYMHNGKNVHELVKEYGLSESRVRQIIREHRNSK